MSEKRSRVSNVIYLLGRQAHDSRAGGINSYGIVAGDENSGRLRDALNRAVAFHSDDSVHDREIGTHRGVDIENGAIDSRPMKNVLRPAVAASRNYAEHVFQRERDAGPVVRL